MPAAFGSIQSSLSRNRIQSPVVRSMPTLRAALRPRFSWWMTVSLPSQRAYSSHSSPEPSVEPSSTTMTSRSR